LIDPSLLFAELPPRKNGEKKSEIDEKYAGPGYKFVVSLLSSNTYSNERIILDVLPLL